MDIIHDPATAPERAVHITTFGFRHAPAPTAHLVIDLRAHFRDPHALDPCLRHMTACDIEIREIVLGTPGIRDLVIAATDAIRAYLAGPCPMPVTVAVGCEGGRHRAPAVGLAITEALVRVKAAPVTLVHRDLNKEVIDR